MDAETLAAAAIIPLERAEHWAPFLTETMETFGIDTVKRQAAFIAQTAHETSGYKRWTESLNYMTAERIFEVFRSRFASVAEAEQFVRSPMALANFVYANRGGNGGVASGDGWSFRGRGLIQITYRDMYRECGKALGMDFESNPDLLASESWASLSAGWYWRENKLNEYADLDLINAISGVINRGSPNKKAVGQDERATLYIAALGNLTA